MTTLKMIDLKETEGGISPFVIVIERLAGFSLKFRKNISIRPSLLA
jgi:hypothetical protein